MMSEFATEDLGNGFCHHGVATPTSNHRGTVATVDGDGRNVVLLWLFDHRGGYALLMIDVETGSVIEFVDPELEALQRQIAERLGFRLVDHRMELFGVKLERQDDESTSTRK